VPRADDRSDRVTLLFGDVGPARWGWSESERVLVLPAEYSAEERAEAFLAWLRHQAEGERGHRVGTEVPEASGSAQ
jgi:hypothetical protein